MKNMILKNGYKIKEEKKKDIVYCRMDKSMIDQLHYIKEQTGISKSELIREAVRRLINESAEKNKVSLSI